MKKNLFYAGMLLLGMTVATGCSNEETLEQVASNGKTIQAVIEKATEARTSVSDNYQVLWTAEDAFSVFDNGTKKATLTLSDGAGSTSGKFTINDSDVTITENMVALFPASDALGYTYAASYNSQETDAPMLGKFADGKFTFSLLTAMVRVVVTNVPEGTAKLTITAGTDIKLTGAATLTNNALGTPDGTNEVTVTINNQTENATLTFDVPVPAQEYTGGLNVTLTVGNDEIFNKTTNEFTAAEGKIYVFGATYVSIDEGNVQATLQEALENGEAIILTGEEEEVSVPSLELPANTTASIDLNGKKLNLGAASTTTLARSTSATHGIINSGTLTISGGEIVYTSEDVNKSAIYNKTSGNITLTNVTVESNNNNYGLLNYGVMTIEGGTIEFTGNTAANGAAVFNAAQIQLNDVDITSNNGCFMNYGDAAKTTLEGLKAEDATVTAVINGGTFNSSFNKSESHTQHRYAVNGAWYSNLTMDGTTIKGSGGVTVNVSFATLTNVKAEHTCQYGAHDLYVPCGNATVTNCTFANAAAYSDDTNGKAVVNGVTYQNGTTAIPTWVEIDSAEELADAFTNGGSYKLTANVNVTKALTATKPITLLMGDNVELTINNSEIQYGLINWSNMTIEGGTINFTGNTTNNGAAVFNAAQIQLDDVNITSNNGCFINYGDATKKTLDGLKAEDATVTAVINEGTFNSSFNKSESHTQHRYAVNGAWYSNLTMDGTTIKGSGGVTVDVSFATLTNVKAEHTCEHGAHDLYVPCGNATVTNCTFANAAAYSDTEYGIAVVNETQYTIPEGQTSVTTPINLNN